MDREILFRGQTRRKGEKVRMDGTKAFFDRHGWFGEKLTGVTHWMHLPEPPKEEL